LIESANARLMPTFERAVERICDAEGRQGLRVVPENHPLGLLATAPDIAAFLARLGRDDVKIIYEVANAAAAGEDSRHASRSSARRSASFTRPTRRPGNGVMILSAPERSTSARSGRNSCGATSPEPWY
jgi:hypothetical protein